MNFLFFIFFPSTSFSKLFQRKQDIYELIEQENSKKADSEVFSGNENFNGDEENTEADTPKDLFYQMLKDARNIQEKSLKNKKVVRGKFISGKNEAVKKTKKKRTRIELIKNKILKVNVTKQINWSLPSVENENIVNISIKVPKDIR